MKKLRLKRNVNHFKVFAALYKRAKVDPMAAKKMKKYRKKIIRQSKNKFFGKLEKFWKNVRKYVFKATSKRLSKMLNSRLVVFNHIKNKLARKSAKD
jgi:hypothetical protein